MTPRVKPKQLNGGSQTAKSKSGPSMAHNRRGSAPAPRSHATAFFGCSETSAARMIETTFDSVGTADFAAAW